MKRKQTLTHDLLQPIKARIRDCLRMSRVIRAKRRVLPDFIIIGAQKAGTTSLYSYITQHPQALCAWEKEVHYFDLNYRRGILWYRSHFPLTPRPGQGSFITGEASPYYLFHPLCPERIQAALPNVKLIVLLRNPVDRAISHYFHEVKLGWEPLPIQEALEKEEQRIEPELTRMRNDPFYHSAAHQHFSYKGRGVYLDQIKPYLNIFHRKQVLILSAEDLFAEPLKNLGHVFDFLGIDSSFMPHNLRARNVGSYTEKVPGKTYESLVDYFASPNEQLYKHLNRDFGW
jgi:hypothetical protein